MEQTDLKVMRLRVWNKKTQRGVRAYIASGWTKEYLLVVEQVDWHCWAMGQGFDGIEIVRDWQLKKEVVSLTLANELPCLPKN